MDVYFLRHGLAVDRDEWRGPDGARPLTDEGREKTRRAARTLDRLGVRPQAIVTSPLVRARQTAEIVAKRLGLEKALGEDPRLGPGFAAAALPAVLEPFAAAAAVLLVGHEPDFSVAIGETIGGADLVMKKGGLALVAVPDPAKPRGTLQWLLPPRVLSAGG